ncbi:glycine betaine ABC transporter substrate-binding protein, partial [Salmonella enterica]|uniref:glycine betaine ABC transporter substrate-binding protein n=1 Tax=Salmonella enterica TaxID=28901 RepID=UPI00390C606D
IPSATGWPAFTAPPFVPGWPSSPTTDWLQPVFASLDEKTLQQLNARIAVEGLDAKKVAADYLRQKGWVK